MRGEHVARHDVLLDMEDAGEGLTDRQRQVCLLILTGYSQDEIAQMLGLNQSTISRHWTRALGKLRRACA